MFNVHGETVDCPSAAAVSTDLVSYLPVWMYCIDISLLGLFHSLQINKSVVWSALPSTKKTTWHKEHCYPQRFPLILYWNQQPPEKHGSNTGRGEVRMTRWAAIVLMISLLQHTALLVHQPGGENEGKNEVNETEEGNILSWTSVSWWSLSTSQSAQTHRFSCSS